MGANTDEAGTTVIPALRYRNVAAAIDWLCKAFGFAKHLVVIGDNGAIRYVQLTFGSGMVMVGPVQESALGKLMRQPDEIGGAETQTCYFVVKDVAAHYARAKAAGAEIVLDIETRANGGLGYSCRDPEGHIWNFGTYNPWRRSAKRPQGAPSQIASRRRRERRRVALAGVLTASVALFAAVVWVWAPHEDPASLAMTTIALEESATAPREASVRPENADEAAQHALAESRDRLARERSAREAAERAYREALDSLTRTRSALDEAESAAQEAREELAGARTSQDARQHSLDEARAQLAQALRDKEAAERAAKEAREQLAQARGAKEAADRSAREARERLAKERSARIAAQRAAPKSSSSEPAIQLPGF